MDPIFINDVQTLKRALIIGASKIGNVA